MPTGVLVEYVKRVNPANLPADHIDALTRLDTQKWFSMAMERGVHAEADPSRAETINLVFEPDSEFLKGYFDRMPADKQQVLAKKLQHIITL